MFSSIISFFTNASKEKSFQPQENNNFSSKSEESVLVESTKKNPQLDDQSRTDSSPQTNLQFSEADVTSVLSDFKNLNFNNSNERFNEIAEDYERKKKSDLFNYVILNKRKEIIDILDQNLADLKKTDSQAYFERQEEFRKKYGRYILKIDEGMNYGKQFKNRLQFSENQAKEVLSDFEKLKLNLVDNKCTDKNDSINFNPHGSRNANPFDKIANYYRYEKDIFLFNYVILTKRKEIIEILDSNEIDEVTKERFKVRLGRYLLRVEEGMDYAKEFLKKDDQIGFFDGCYWPNEKARRYVNHYDNLTINIKPEEKLEISRLFSEKTKRMETIEHEVERVEICSNGKRIVTVKKNKEQQRNYCFEKDAICNMEIRWSAEDKKGEFVDCFIILNVNSDKIEWKVTIDGEAAELGKILKLAEQNKDVLIEDESLHEFLLETDLKQDPQSQEEIVTLETTPPIPPVRFLFDSLKSGELEAGCIGGGYDDRLIRYSSSHPPRSRLYEPSTEEKLHPDYREWDR